MINSTLLKLMPWSIDSLIENGSLPDFLIRLGIRGLLKDKLKELSDLGPAHKDFFLQSLERSYIAIHEDQANSQHYEVPTEYFKYCLGKNLKYSCALYEGTRDLDIAEEKMFDLVIERAQIEDGQSILELGCGWGSLSLYLAKRFPNSKIVALSNSKTQKQFIDFQILDRKLSNLEIRTANIKEYQTDERFDRIVSVEMFEHMRNYTELLNKIYSWLSENGKLFVHIFCHKEYCYPYEVKDETDWMSKYFFTGGIMPSFDIFEKVQSRFQLEKKWAVNGNHYFKTCEDWLSNMDKYENEIMLIFNECYPKGEAKKWFNYWRVFYMACGELFKFNRGEEWFVGHFLLRK